MPALPARRAASATHMSPQPRRALSRRLGWVADLTQKEVLAAWRDELSQLRQKRSLERLKEESVAFKAQSDELTRRVLSMMLGGQVDLG